MCGLTGFFTSRPRTDESMTADVSAMMAPIHHRGPDDGGHFIDAESGIALGFRRLAIIDLSPLGHQPMASVSGRYVLAFNGEIYNYAALREELAALGATFRGGSDTEVILAAFEAWGVRTALPRFVGMFAMSLWDRRERELTLIRDRLGKKPLFVYAEPGYISWGSELKSMVAGSSFDRSIDPAAVVEYLRYLYVPAPRSIYRRVRKLEPGASITIRDPDQPLPTSDRYWSLEAVAEAGEAQPFRGSDTEAVDRLEALLADAVKLRLYSDVPLGALLSGGIDSSTVVALMQEQMDRPVKTYTIGFEEKEYDEVHHAEAVAKHLGTDQTTLRLAGTDVLDLIPRLSDWFDEPLADPSQLPTFLVCQLAKQDVTVALSGDGGDELFAGYNRYRFGRRLLDAVGYVPRALRGPVGGLLRQMGRSGGDLRSRTGKLRKLGEFLSAPSEGYAYRSLLSAWQDPGSLVPGVVEEPGLFVETMERQRPHTVLSRMMLADQRSYLPDDLLAKVDRVSMAVSLEARAPILDHRVAEFAWTLPDSLRIRGDQTKWILRQVLYRKVPQALVDRPKMGFSVPISAWLRGPLRSWGDDLLASERLGAVELLDAGRCREAWNRLQAGEEHRSLALWSLLVFLDWHGRWARG